MVDGVVDRGECVEDGEGRRGKELPLPGWEGVEVLPATVGGVVVGIFAVLALGLGQLLLVDFVGVMNVVFNILLSRKGRGSNLGGQVLDHDR
jgi:hypothetical protein